MSFQRVHLRKLLQIFYLPKAARISSLRSDIRMEISKESGGASGGGDFYVPFWADVKAHVADQTNLNEQTQIRIDSNERRKRLYPQLADGFLTWWNEKRRWVNEPYEFLEDSVKAQYPVPSLNSVVKVENLLSVKIGDNTHRLIYPYFSEEPTLTKESARIGLWLLGEALPSYQIQDIRILDVLRGVSFSTNDNKLNGNEEETFLYRYESILLEWNKLREEY